MSVFKINKNDKTVRLSIRQSRWRSVFQMFLDLRLFRLFVALILTCDVLLILPGSLRKLVVKCFDPFSLRLTYGWAALRSFPTILSSKLLPNARTMLLLVRQTLPTPSL